MTTRYITASTTCPDCEEAIPATFMFKSDNCSEELSLRCQECGAEFSTEVDRGVHGWLGLYVDGEYIGETIVGQR